MPDYLANQFVVIYKIDDVWKVDTGIEGEVAGYEELETALERVKYLRLNGVDACLANIIE